MKLFLNKKISLALLLLAIIVASALFVFYSKKINQSDIKPKIITVGPSYSEVVNDKTKSYVGKNVSWTGKIAYNLSQIDGVKLWIVDEQHKTVVTTNWFWAIPLDDPTANETNGEWVAYILKRFGGINTSKVDVENDRFLVAGILRESDCSFYDGQCIPNLEIERIERVEAK